MKYELSFLTPNIEIKTKDELLQKIEEEIKNLKGQVKEKFIEKKIFAYPVKKHEEGFLGSIDFEIEPQNIKKLKKILNLNENILREIIERKEKIIEQPARRERPMITKTDKPPLVKKVKAKIEDLDQKLEEILE